MHLLVEYPPKVPVAALVNSLSGRAPLLIVLHGSGTSGRDVATTFTGLATRTPTAGVTAVFPDGWRGVWHVAGAPADQPDLDDAAFLAGAHGASAGD